jgi:hypothetical protein
LIALRSKKFLGNIAAAALFADGGELTFVRLQQAAGRTTKRRLVDAAKLVAGTPWDARCLHGSLRDLGAVGQPREQAIAPHHH